MNTKRLGSGDVISLTMVAGAFALSAALYQRLPAVLPTHFDRQGVANGFMSRAVGAWFFPGVALAIWALLRPGALLLPADWRARMQASPFGLIAALMVGLMVAVHCAILHAALAQPTSMASSLGLLLGAFWIALGLVFPRVRRNPWFGVRTPWSLSSDENWARTHRFAGITFLAGGLLAVVVTLLGGRGLATPIIVTSAFVPAVYSFFLARRLPPQS